MIGDEASPQSRNFTSLSCFGINSGTIASIFKEGVKLYFYNLRSAQVKKAKHEAIEAALVDALGQGMSPAEAALRAQKVGAKAAKLLTHKFKRIIGPAISSLWEFLQAIYCGGSFTEGLLRGTGTLVGTYVGGFLGDQHFGRSGYLLGSHLGSWFGGRVGLMVYDVINGAKYLLYSDQPEETEPYQTLVEERLECEESSAYQCPAYTNSEVAEDSHVYDSPAYESFESCGDSEIR